MTIPGFGATVTTDPMGLDVARGLAMLGSSGDADKEQEAVGDTVMDTLRALLLRSEDHPHDANALMRIGVLLFGPLHRPDEALPYLRHAMEVDPANVDALFWYAELFFHDFLDFETVERTLGRALRLDPGRPDCLSLMASVALSMVTDPVCAHRRALQYIQQALERGQGWPSLWLMGATSLRVLGRRREAREFARKGLEVIGLLAPPCDPVEVYYEEVVTGRLSAVTLEALTHQASM